MFSKMRAAAGLLTFSSMLWSAQASPLNSLDSRQAQCAAYANGGVVVYISTNVISYPVIINQFFQSNTNIVINGGVTININNAPTSLSTTVTVTTTTTSTSTATATTTTTATAVPTAPSFVIAVAVAPALDKRFAKRQSGGYLSIVGGVAKVVADKGSAALFSISGGLLVSSGQFVGLNSFGGGYAAFQVFASPPSFAQTWSAAIAGPVQFSNSAFTIGAGFATFCEDTNNNVYIEATSAPAFTCAFISLIAETPLPSSSTSTTGSATGSVTSGASSSSGTGSVTSSVSGSVTSGASSVTTSQSGFITGVPSPTFTSSGSTLIPTTTSLSSSSSSTTSSSTTDTTSSTTSSTSSTTTTSSATSTSTSSTSTTTTTTTTAGALKRAEPTPVGRRGIYRVANPA